MKTLLIIKSIYIINKNNFIKIIIDKHNKIFIIYIEI